MWYDASRVLKMEEEGHHQWIALEPRKGKVRDSLLELPEGNTA